MGPETGKIQAVQVILILNEIIMKRKWYYKGNIFTTSNLLG
jgi:hypothetical protein